MGGYADGGYVQSSEPAPAVVPFSEGRTQVTSTLSGQRFSCSGAVPRVAAWSWAGERASEGGQTIHFAAATMVLSVGSVILSQVTCRSSIVLSWRATGGDVD